MTNEQNLVMLYIPNQIGDRQYYNQPQTSFLINSYEQPVYCMQSPQGVFYLNSYLNFPRNSTSLTTIELPHEAEDFDLMIRIAENAYDWFKTNGYFEIEKLTVTNGGCAKNYVTAGFCGNVTVKSCKKYVKAGCYVGWFQKQEEGKEETYGFTDLGKDIFAQRYQPDYIFRIVNSVFNDPIFYQCACFYSQNAYFPDENTFKQIVEYEFWRNNLTVAGGWTSSTWSQRYNNCMRWFNKIIQLITPSPDTVSCCCQ